jgi:hypothetical protein
MTKRATQVAVLVAALLLGGSAVFLMAKQTSKAPADTANYFCPMQTMGRHMGMQSMMMSGRSMSSGMMAGKMKDMGNNHCNFTGQSPSTGNTAPKNQSPGPAPQSAPSIQP